MTTRRETPEAAPSILALDLSLNSTGYCMDGESGVLRPKSTGWGRIDYLYEHIMHLSEEAEVAVLEGYSYHSRGRGLFNTAELGGIIRYGLRYCDTPIVDVPPSSLKLYAAGRGNAGKDEMIAAAIRRFGFPGSDNNEADAYLLWCMALHGYGFPVVDVPMKQAEQVERIEWPLLEEG